MSDIVAPRDVCGCLPEPDTHTLAPPQNVPGQPALRFRIGTHADFLRRMLDALPLATSSSGARPLAALTVRSSDDPALALLDAFAVMADVLAFYQERIANEGFLRTATERRSVLELAREIGYELAPGVDAATFLAFTLEDALTAPPQVTIAAHSRVQSLPPPGKMPQIFETAADLDARTAWNALRPRALQPQDLLVYKHKLYLSQAPRPHAPGVGGGRPEMLTRRRWLARQIYLEGTQLNLKPGDVLMVESGGVVLAVEVRRAVVEAEAGRTRAELAEPLPLPQVKLPWRPAAVVDRTPAAQTLPNVDAKIVRQRWEESDLQAFLTAQRWDPELLLTQVESLRQSAVRPRARVYAFRQTVGFFGSTAPPWRSLPVEHRPYPSWDTHPPHTIWTDGSDNSYRSGSGSDVFLERDVDSIGAGSWTVFRHPRPAAKMRKGRRHRRDDLGDRMRAFYITAVSHASLAEFALTGKATGLRLAEPRRQLHGPHVRHDVTTGTVPGTSIPLTAPHKGTFPLRHTRAYVESEALTLSELPLDAPVQELLRRDDGTPLGLAGALSIELDRMVIGLVIGQPILVSGVEYDEAAPTGVTRREVARIQRISHANGYTTLHFAHRLQYRYARAGLIINANVVAADHGETQPTEVLGSGDGAQVNQSFALQNKPLTYESAPTASGVQSALTVRVNGVAWDEVPTLYGQPPRARAYMVRHDDEGGSTITFGDGKMGARLPSGQENVVAHYRRGLGLDGEVPAGSLTLLQSPVPGIRSVENPLAATGAADPERLEEARVNAPRHVLTIDRIVSLDDYEDFARAFAGIGKAQAESLWSGDQRLVHVTIAGANGDPVDSDLPLYQSLTQAIADVSDGLEPFVVASYRGVPFMVAADVAIESHYDAKLQRLAVADALRRTFAVERRDFGQPVTASEVTAAMQAVPGVIHAELRTLAIVGKPATGAQPPSLLPAARAHWDGAVIRPAELLVLLPTAVDIREFRG